MNKTITFILLFILLDIQLIYSQKAWEKNLIQIPYPVCYGSGIVEDSHIPPPDEYLKRLKSNGTQTADIIVKYINFPDYVKEVFEKAVNIWEFIIDSPIPIYMEATWSATLGENTLGSCGPASYLRTFEGALYPDIYYPIALVEKIQRSELTGKNSPDIIANFNKNTNWYFGTDGEPPITQYDFFSTVLHEIAHGLGFTGFFYTTENDWGGYGLESINKSPTIYDYYVSTTQKIRLTDTEHFNNPSEELYQQLTSTHLKFISPIFLNQQEENPFPKLYAPYIWNDGSSIYHLDNNAYPPGDENSLMTSSLGFGESILDPGPLTSNILADLGWKYLYIVHEEIKDIEQIIEPIEISANIQSDFMLDSSSVYVYFSEDEFESIDSMQLSYQGTNSLFQSELPVNIEEGTITYYLTASDSMGREFFSPSFAPDSYYNIHIGQDTIPPTINHQPLKYVLTNDDSLKIEVEADDNLKIDSVYTEYLVNGVPQKSIVLKNDSSTFYSINLPLEEFSLVEGDSIQYRILALDASSNQNSTILPDSGYYSILAHSVFDPVVGYLNDFNNDEEHFITSGFSLKNEENFSDRALHSDHPYISPNMDDTYYNFFAILKYPVILQDEATMDFDEIVLVEPGGHGSEYGDIDFWDYVIIEGSKDGGESWLPITDGYDSRLHSSWLNKYNADAEGEDNLYIAHNVNILGNGNFNSGDTVLFRFRLLSDPYANGWGWVIDNLHIQIPVSNKIIPEISPGIVSVYPNPFNDKINLIIENDPSIETIHIYIYNMYGQQTYFQEESNIGNILSSQIDLSDLTDGIYLINIINNNKKIYSQKIIKSN